MDTNNTQLDLEADISDGVKTQQSKQGDNNSVVTAENAKAQEKKGIVLNNKPKILVLLAVIAHFLYSIKKSVVTFFLLLSRILAFFPDSAIKTYNFCVSCGSSSEGSGTVSSGLCFRITGIIGKFFYWCKDLIT